MRQIAILDKIRQSGNCKLKEIQEVLPDTSERTIRYDIEELIERNLIERIGSGGPAVSYRIRQISAEPAIRQ
jgi:DeoR/GlpR family transcriptional regulator of sugar metabolism